MATVPVTGLSALGNVFSNLGSQIGAQRRQDELNARARQLQLEDREAAIRESDRQYERARKAQLDDRTAAEKRQDDLYTRQRGDALVDRYLEDGLREAAAIRERTRALAERAPFEKNLQATVDDAATQLNDVRRRIDDVSRRVTSQPAPINPNDANVIALAQQMAGGSRNREEIAAMVPKALEQLQAESIIRHQNSVRAAQDVLQSLKNSETQLVNLVQSGIQQRVAPRVAPTPPTASEAAGLRSLTDAPTQPMRQATPEDIAAAVNQALGGGQPGGAAGSATPREGQLFANPDNNPLIAAGNAEIAARGPAMLQAELNDVTRQIDERRAALQSASVPRTPSLGMGLGGYSVTSSPDPVGGARAATSELQSIAALEDRRRKLEAQLRGPTVGAATPPALSSPTSSTPSVQFAAPAGRWWETVAPTN